MLVTLPACTGTKVNIESTLDSAVKKLFQPRKTPQRYMLIAVSDTDPDVRRNAVAKVAQSKKCEQEWAIKGFIAIALLEDDSQARCVAIRALAQSGDPRAAETCLKILNHQKHPPAEVRPPDALCRWDATAALARLAGELPENSRDQVLETLIERLQNDPDRHVRLAAARGLKRFQEPSVIRALVEGLRDEDFCVVHECENSLAWLTGATHGCDPYRWRDWLAANEDNTFDRGGTLPPSRRPPYSGRWGKLSHQTKQLLLWLFPGAKEK